MSHVAGSGTPDVEASKTLASMGVVENAICKQNSIVPGNSFSSKELAPAMKFGLVGNETNPSPTV